MTPEQIDKEREHYFDLGIRTGKRKFNSISFLEGLSIGISVGYLIFYFAFK